MITRTLPFLVAIVMHSEWKLEPSGAVRTCCEDWESSARGTCMRAEVDPRGMAALMIAGSVGIEGSDCNPITGQRKSAMSYARRTGVLATLDWDDDAEDLEEWVELQSSASTRRTASSEPWVNWRAATAPSRLDGSGLVAATEDEGAMEPGYVGIVWARRNWGRTADIVSCRLLRIARLLD